MSAFKKLKHSNDSVQENPTPIADSINTFEGCKLCPTKTVKVTKLDSKLMYYSYILYRQPVIINGHITDKEWCGPSWSNKYLSDKAGDCNVRVEWREDSTGRFGKGNEKRMQFSDFLNLMDNKDENVYLTTQELSYNIDGQPSIISPPLTLLRDDYPLVPSLFKNLIVSNINMWFGSSTTLTTSGLHHDFHDNLYILLRGEKRFTLYSPAEALNMYTVGEIVKVHPNGRINYKDQLTRADGADLHADAAIGAAKRMERAALKLAQVEGNEVDDEAEDELDSALEAMLDAEIGSMCDDDEDDDEEEGSDVDGFEGFDGNDDYCDSDEEGDEGEDGEEEEEHDSDNDSDSDADSSDDNSDSEKKPIDKKNTSNSSGNDKTSKKNKRNLSSFLGLDTNSNKKSTAAASSAAAGDKEQTATSTTPSNFSRVDTKLSDTELAKQFPLFYDARQRGAGVTITIKAGQMLYIPAGWFHEVESRGTPESGGHLAFNYWFHPPDGLDVERPYTSDFWSEDFKTRLANGNI